MKQKHKAKLQARDRKQAKQARRVINGIFTGLIAITVLVLILYQFVWG